MNNDMAGVRRLLDKDQIIDLVHQYSYCVDHGLYDEVVELFTEDCVVDYGPIAPQHILEPRSGRCSDTLEAGLTLLVTTTPTSW